MRSDSGTDQTRLRLLTAAAQEILERGYAGASLSRIGERIGLTKGAFSHHFPTKISIVDALIAHVVGRIPAISLAAEDAFPGSPIRACVAVIGGVASATRADPVFGAAILAFQDPGIESAKVAPLRRAVGEAIGERLRRAEQIEGYRLAMDVADAVQYVQVLLAGFLSSARFAETFREHQEPLFLKATLEGIGIRDADAVIADVLRALAAE